MIRRVKDVVTNIGSGTTPKSGEPRYYDNANIPWLNSGDLNNGIVNSTAKCITPDALTDYPTLRFYSKGCVVVAMYGASIGKTGLLEIDTTVNQACCVLLPNLKYITSSYLHLLLQLSKERFLIESFGGTQPNISQKIVANLLIEVPSLREQELQTAYLDKKCEKIGRQIELLERKADAYKRLRRSLINRAFSSNIWEKKRIKDVFNIIGGNGFKEELQGKISGDYPFVKTSDINSKGVYLISAANYVDESEVHSYRFNIVPINSIICSKIGAALKLNHRKLTTQETVIDNNLQALVPYDGYNPKFYYYVLTLVDMSRFDNLGAIPCVNNKLLRNYHIPVPPIKEQREIVAYLDDKCGKIDAIIEKIAAKVERLKELKRSLINEVVTGKRAFNNILR